MRSLSKRASESALASSVLPTPVGPRKMNEPIGLFSSLSPALARSIASDTAWIPSSCPITRLCRISGSLRSLSLSVSTSLLTGMPVHEEMTSAISSSVTSSCSRRSSLAASALAFFSSSCLSSPGRTPFLSSASFSRSYCLSASSISSFIFSICSLRFFISRMSFFSFYH